MKRIAFGGGCHWCTEAVFQRLKGVLKVEQGYVASEGEDDYFSEAVLIRYDPEIIRLDELVEVHLHTHKSTKAHSLRHKYRSAIYIFSEADRLFLERIWDEFQAGFPAPLITRILPFREFRPSGQEFRNYYRSDPERPFCRRYIVPKLDQLREEFPSLQKTRDEIS